MVYGKTGFLPLKIDIENRIVAYWSKLCEDMNNLSPMTENDVLNKYPWLAKVKHILISCGLNNIWNNHSFINSKWLNITTKQKLYDLFVNDW